MWVCACKNVCGSKKRKYAHYDQSSMPQNQDGNRCLKKEDNVICNLFFFCSFFIRKCYLQPCMSLMESLKVRTVSNVFEATTNQIVQRTQTP